MKYHNEKGETSKTKTAKSNQTFKVTASFNLELDPRAHL